MFYVVRNVRDASISWTSWMRSCFLNSHRPEYITGVNEIADSHRVHGNIKTMLSHVLTVDVNSIVVTDHVRHPLKCVPVLLLKE
jgi:hypothetical protein